MTEYVGWRRCAPCDLYWRSDDPLCWDCGEVATDRRYPLLQTSG